MVIIVSSKLKWICFLFIPVPVSIYLFIKNYSVYQHMKEIAAEVERTGQNVSQGVTFEQEGAIRQEV